MSLPHIPFAFCYLAAHFGLDIVEGPEVEKLVDDVVAHERDLAALVLQGAQQKLAGNSSSACSPQSVELDNLRAMPIPKAPYIACPDPYRVKCATGATRRFRPLLTG